MNTVTAPTLVTALSITHTWGFPDGRGNRTRSYTHHFQDLTDALDSNLAPLILDSLGDLHWDTEMGDNPVVYIRTATAFLSEYGQDYREATGNAFQFTADDNAGIAILQDGRLDIIGVDDDSNLSFTGLLRIVGLTPQYTLGTQPERPITRARKWVRAEFGTDAELLGIGRRMALVYPMADGSVLVIDPDLGAIMRFHLDGRDESGVITWQ